MASIANLEKVFTDSVKQDWKNLANIEQQTPEMCMIALQQNPKAIEFIRNPTPEMCMLAIKADASNLSLIKNKTPEIMDAINAYAKNSIEKSNKTIQDTKSTLEAMNTKLSLYAVQTDGLRLKEITTQTPEICLAAVHQNGLALQYVKEQTHEICLAAVKQNPMSLQHAKVVTPEIIAVVQKPCKFWCC